MKQLQMTHPVGTLSSFKLALLPLGLVLMLNTAARADFNPVPLTANSFTYDIIVEKTARGASNIYAYATASMDGGTSQGTGQYCWYEFHHRHPLGWLNGELAQRFGARLQDAAQLCHDQRTDD